MISASYCWKSAGHHPWYEKHAKEDFFKALEEEVGR